MQGLAAEAHVRTMQLMPPPIPFYPPKKKGHDEKNCTKQQETPEDSTKYILFDCRMDPKDKHSKKVTCKLKVFEDGTPEEYCKWQIDYDDLVTHPSFNKVETRVSVLLSILKGKTRDLFITCHAKQKEENDSEEEKDRMTDLAVLEHALNDMAHDVFKMKKAASWQKHYMRNGLFLNSTVHDWAKCLLELNKYFPYFPVDDMEDGYKVSEGFAQDELTDILDCAKPTEWQTIILNSNIDILDMTWDEIVEYALYWLYQ